jgi:REP element-mobilizing transposase RayT
LSRSQYKRHTIMTVSCAVYRARRDYIWLIRVHFIISTIRRQFSFVTKYFFLIKMIIQYRVSKIKRSDFIVLSGSME